MSPFNKGMGFHRRKMIYLRPLTLFQNLNPWFLFYKTLSERESGDLVKWFIILEGREGGVEHGRSSIFKNQQKVNEERIGDMSLCKRHSNPQTIFLLVYCKLDMVWNPSFALKFTHETCHLKWRESSKKVNLRTIDALFSDGNIIQNIFHSAEI